MISTGSLCEDHTLGSFTLLRTTISNTMQIARSKEFIANLVQVEDCIIQCFLEMYVNMAKFLKE